MARAPEARHARAKGAAPPTSPVRVGQRVTLPLTGLAGGGEAVGRAEGLVVFVEGGAPGDEAEVEIVEVRKTFARGRLRGLRARSPLRVAPPCAIYAECGGCQLQHLTYEAQREAKSGVVADALRAIAGLGDCPVAACLPTSPWAYRNKMQLVAAPDSRLGLYRRHSHDVVAMDSCHIAHPLANRILAAVTELLPQTGWASWDERTGRGLLRHVLARVAGPPGHEEALVVLVVSSQRVERLEAFREGLVARVPQVVGLALNINPQRTNVILGRTTLHVWGRDHLVETLGGVQFAIGPTSFFQVNTEGLSLLCALVSDMLDPSPALTVVDAYCGVGALSLPLARRVGQVVGIEEVGEAVENATRNGKLNGITNASFLRGTVEALLPTLPQPGAIILDPPRKGCAASVIDAIVAQKVPVVVYVSCNPATLARDVARFVEHGYTLRRVQPVDMFPQTAHVECVVRLDAASTDEDSDDPEREVR